nr:probable polyamine transporter At3g13620 [Tanacetum cinerariifolium]
MVVVALLLWLNSATAKGLTAVVAEATVARVRVEVVAEAVVIMVKVRSVEAAGWLGKFPTLKRPYKVPLGIPGLVVMCLIPSAFLILIMVIATKIVFLVSGLMTVGAIIWYFLMNYCKSKKWFVFANGDDVKDEELSS